jgi:parvulin-like peptidyl-prolyl isomerase
MARARFMTMRWLREHIKEIIWGTTILFVLSIFLIGYGTSRAAKQQDERNRQGEEALRQAQAAADEVPARLQGKLPLPVVHISYPTQAASITQVLTVEAVFKGLMSTQEYRRLATLPAQLREAFGNQLKEGLLERLIMQTLLDLYARANNITPGVTGTAIVEQERQAITAAEFDKRLRREGITVGEYARQRVLQETFRKVFSKVTEAKPAETVTDEYLKKFYEENKLWFKKDDEISLKHLLVSPSLFVGMTAEVSDDEIKAHFDAHRGDFKSGKRASVRHLFVNPADALYLDAATVDDATIRARYQERLNEFKEPEQAQARHILLKPQTTFDETLEHFSLNLRQFTLEGDPAVASESESPAEPTGQRLYSMTAGITPKKPGMKLELEDFALTTVDGATVHPTPESLARVDTALSFPVTEGSQRAIRGTIAFLLPAGAAPKTLVVKDGTMARTLDVAVAHDEEAAFVEAGKQAEEIKKQLDGGADFAELAKRHSQDPGSGAKGGDLGTFGRGQMVKPFEDAVFKAPLHTVIGPVRSTFGQHLIKVEKRNPERVRKFEEVSATLTEEARIEHADMRAAAAIDMARSKIMHGDKTFREMIKELSMATSRKEDGQLPIFFGGEITDDYSAAQKATLAAEIGQNGRIHPEIEEAIFKTKPGEVTPVIKSEKGYHLFLVEKILEEVPLSLTPSLKEHIRELLERQKQESQAQAKAQELSTRLTAANFAAIASETTSNGEVDLGPLPFSANPGLSSYALSSGIGQVSVNGMTWLPELHKALNDLVSVNRPEKGGAPWDQKIVGPVKSELGYHLMLITAYEHDRYTPFDEVKADLRQMLTQKPDEEKIKSEFEKNRETFDRPATRKLRQILVHDEIVAKDLHKRLQNGEIFSLLAQRYSIDGTGPTGGDIGQVKKGQFPAEADEIVWKLKPQEFSPPLQTSYGWIIVLMEGETPGQKAELSKDIRDRLAKKLQEELKQQLFEKFLDGLKQRAHIVRNHTLLAEL